MPGAVLDAWAIMAWLKGQQPAAERVRFLLDAADRGERKTRDEYRESRRSRVRLLSHAIKFAPPSPHHARLLRISFSHRASVLPYSPITASL
jgi:hypothetical protein